MKASLLTVGTEITSGEILNRNSAWLASELERRGVEVILHLSAPDDRPLMHATLKMAAPLTDLVIVTGGLGPTSDDFTREVVAAFSGQSLEFHEPTWQALQALYRDRGLPLREAHKQQCYFPVGCEILQNPVGTAQGFRVGQIFVLPGPPREVEGVFEKGVIPWLDRQGIRPTRALRVFKCLGAPESEVAEVVEAALAANKQLLLGYRASHPYVLVKVWHPPGDLAWIESLRTALKPWLVGEDAFDLARAWLDKAGAGVRVIDTVTGGKLVARLEALAPVGVEVVTDWAGQAGTDVFRIDPAGENGYRVTALIGGRDHSRVLDLPYRISRSSDRGRLWMAEHALRTWLEMS